MNSLGCVNSERVVLGVENTFVSVSGKTDASVSAYEIYLAGLLLLTTGPEDCIPHCPVLWESHFGPALVLTPGPVILSQCIRSQF